MDCIGIYVQQMGDHRCRFLPVTLPGWQDIVPQGLQRENGERSREMKGGTMRGYEVERNASSLARVGKSG